MDLTAALSFLVQVKTDAWLAAEVSALDTEPSEDELAAITKIARSHGFVFEKDALVAAFAQLRDTDALSDTQLEEVAGGLSLVWDSSSTSTNQQSGLAIEKIELAVEKVERA